MTEPNPNMTSVVTQIASDVLGFDTLETRRSASDFREVAVWQVRDALYRAFEAGKKTEALVGVLPLEPHRPKHFDVTIVEVLIHRTTLEARGTVEANELARDMWDEDGPEAFSTETLGRTDLIIADEEVRP